MSEKSRQPEEEIPYEPYGRIILERMQRIVDEKRRQAALSPQQLSALQKYHQKLEQQEKALGITSFVQAGRANNKNLFLGDIPGNNDLVDLVVRLDAETSKPENERRSWNEIAREYTGETVRDQKKAQSLLTQIRALKRKGRINL